MFSLCPTSNLVVEKTIIFRGGKRGLVHDLDRLTYIFDRSGKLLSDYRPRERARRLDGYVDAEGDVVAEFGPNRVGADFDAGDLGGPVLGEENVVDVVGAIFVVPIIVRGSSLLALEFGKEMMVSAGEAVFL